MTGSTDPRRPAHVPTDADLLNLFTYHPPSGDEQIEAYQRIREGGLTLARLIVELAPSSADRTTAIREVRSAIMWANAAIACAPPEDRQ